MFLVAAGLISWVWWDSQQWREVTISEVRVGDDDRTLGFVIDSCQAETAVDLSESPDDVRIAVRVRHEECDVGHAGTVVLDHPLGDRQVIDVHGDHAEPVTQDPEL